MAHYFLIYARPTIKREGFSIKQARPLTTLHQAPPVALVAVQLALMCAAKRNCELAARLSPQRARPDDLQVLRIARPCPANQAGLRRHKSGMRLAAPAHRFGKARDYFRVASGFAWL
jgi:hypothetical protein